MWVCASWRSSPRPVATCAFSTCCCTARSGSRRQLEEKRRGGRQGRHPGRGGSPSRAPGLRRGRAPGGDRGRPGLRARPGAVARGQRRGQRARWSHDADGGRRRALRVRLDVLELRAHAGPDVADRRGRRARARSRSTPSRRSAIEQHAARRASGRRCAHLPALRDRLRRRAADALRPHGERVHARPVGRPRRSRSSASSSGARTSTSRDAAARDRTVLDAPPERSAAQVFNVGALRRELPQARPRRDDHAASSDRGDVRYVHRDEDPRDYKVELRQDPRASSASRPR